MTRAEYLRHAHAGHKVPDLTIPYRCNGLIQYFHNVRSFAGVIDNPITMSVIKDWQDHTYVTLQRWERDCIFAMDRAFRRAYNDVVKYHSTRKQVKLGKDKDWARANNG